MKLRVGQCARVNGKRVVVKNRKRRGENQNAESRGHPGREFWGRRLWGGLGKDDKDITHRLERRAGRSEVYEQMKEETDG
jgi:hypothetical protein